LLSEKKKGEDPEGCMTFVRKEREGRTKLWGVRRRVERERRRVERERWGR
jgi:hypothetical protein